MQEKEELKKQVIILGVILAIVIVVAVVLNINKSNNINSKTTNIKGETSQNTIVQTKDEMLNNLKGLIEQQPQEETLDTSGAKTENTTSGETIQYLEMEYD